MSIFIYEFNLCQSQTKAERSKLRCIYHATSSWLRLGPFKVNVNSLDPLHLTIKDLLYPYECDQIRVGLASKLQTYPGIKPDIIRRGEWMDVRVMKK